jgi:hypothetical protein
MYCFPCFAPGYAKLAPKLVDSLLDSIQLEEEGANEFEVNAHTHTPTHRQTHTHTHTHTRARAQAHARRHAHPHTHRHTRRHAHPYSHVRSVGDYPSSLHPVWECYLAISNLTTGICKRDTINQCTLFQSQHVPPASFHITGRSDNHPHV